MLALVRLSDNSQIPQRTTSYLNFIFKLSNHSLEKVADIDEITRIINVHPFPEPLQPALLWYIPPATLSPCLVENVLGRLFASHSNGLKALEFFKFPLQQSHSCPSSDALEKALHILTRMRYFDKAWELLEETRNTHTSPITLKSMSIMLSKIAKYKTYEDTLEAFRRMDNDIFVGRKCGTDEFNVLLKAFCTQRRMKEAKSVFQMMYPRFLSNTKTMDILLLGLGIRIDAYCKKSCFGDGLRLLEEMERKNYIPTIETITTLIHGAGLVRNLSKAWQLFNEIHLRNTCRYRCL